MNRIYSATYSNVPVYELNVAGNHVMRRRIDDWINATHILKVAEFDKPARTRILEREVQKGTHEKVQGGYGKYQGTWIPLPDGRALATKNRILDKLLPILDFVPGDRSPPPAPKHATAAAGKPKPRQAVQQRRVPGRKPKKPSHAPSDSPLTTSTPVPHVRQSSEISYNDSYSQNRRLNGETPDDVSIVESEDDPMRGANFTGGSRKRKRNVYAPEILSYEDQEHTAWADQLLDFFMMQRQEDMYPPPERPQIPHSIDLNRGLDNKGFTAMHWAAAMADVELVRELSVRGARIDPQSPSGGETPLIRSVLFTNNYDRQTMEPLIEILSPSINSIDYTGSTVFHHIANSTNARSRYGCARYYLGAILDHLKRNWPVHVVKNVLDRQDRNGDTPVLIAARNGARKCVRMMVELGANVSIPNNRFETAEKLIADLNARNASRRRHGASGALSQLPPSSSPVQPSNALLLPEDRPSSAIPFDGLERPAKKPRYNSDAASLVASQLPDLLANRVRSLADSLEGELKEKDRETREAEALLEQRTQEVEALRYQNDQMAGQYQLGGEGQEQALSTEVHLLHDSAKDLHHAEMAAEFSRLLQQECASVPATDDMEEDPASKLRNLRSIRAAEAEHEKWQAALLDAISTSGNEDRTALYRRVMGSAMNMDPSKVDEDLPDIIDELVNQERRGAPAKDGMKEESSADLGALGGLARASIRLAGGVEAMVATGGSGGLTLA